MAFIPDVQTLALYVLACVILFITPGPDMSLWLAKTLTGGRRGGLAAMLGTQAGCVFHTLLAAVGLSALLAASATAFTVLKIVGALYLGWLAVQAIRSGSALSVSAGNAGDVPSWRTFLVGLGINITNPKVVLFFVTFLPQFVGAHDPDATGKLLFLGLAFTGLNLMLAFWLILGAEQIVEWLKRRPGIVRVVVYVFAGVFGFFAIRILTTQGR
jgi:threonine/homoserine/homoserine lactone efflux protein